MSTSTLISRIAAGASLAGALPALCQDRKRTIALLLEVLSGIAPLVVIGNTDPRDAHDNVMSALLVVGGEVPEHLVDLLDSALARDDRAQAFPLTWTLAHLRCPFAAEVLMSAASGRDSYVRWAACIGLRRLRVRRARGVLNKAAADRDSLVRGEAVDALRQLGDASSLPVLQKRLHDRYPGIRDAARRAIEAIRARSSGRQR